MKARAPLRGLAAILATLALVAVILHLMLMAAPGDPLATLPPGTPAEVRAAMRAALGLDDPGWLRLVRWLWQLMVIEPVHLLNAALGTDWASAAPRLRSTVTHLPVIDTILSRAPQTLIVVGLAWVVALASSLPLGLAAGARPDGLADHIAKTWAAVGLSTPSFLIGAVLLWVFAVELGWVPLLWHPDAHGALYGLQLVLPVLVIAFQIGARTVQVAAAAMAEVRAAPFYLAAEARGRMGFGLLWHHALRHVLVPVVALVGTELPQVVGGAVVTEQLFGINGLGQLMVISVAANDVPMVMTLVMVLATLVIVCARAADALARRLDPRLRDV